MTTGPLERPNTDNSLVDPETRDAEETGGAPNSRDSLDDFEGDAFAGSRGIKLPLLRRRSSFSSPTTAVFLVDGGGTAGVVEVAVVEVVANGRCAGVVAGVVDIVVAVLDERVGVEGYAELLVATGIVRVAV